ncbi:MAG: AAA family ATPase [Prevotella sp.]|nr:AAA family ATPase [Prevotella sp.]
MNKIEDKDLKNDSSTIQAQESGAQSSTPETTVKSPIDAGRAILDEVMNQPNEEAKRMAELTAMRIKSSPLLEPAETILAIDDVSVIESKDIYLIKGKPKSGKSSILKAFICAIILGQWGRVKAFVKNLKILYIDTEQKPQDCQSVLLYVKQATNCSDGYLDEHVMLFSVRKRERNLLTDDLAFLVKNWKPNLIILDGAADFVGSFNDEIECTTFVHRLLCIVEENDCALIGLIHENKAIDDFNAKGHLGSQFQQKSALIIEAKKVGELIKATSSAARHQSMPDWYLCYDENGMLQDGTDAFSELMDSRTKSLRDANRAKSEKLTKERVEIACSIIRENNGRISRKDLTSMLIERIGVSRSHISTFISNQLGKTIFLVNDMIQETPEAELPF